MLDPVHLSEVIGLIYEAASDASAWPPLLERLGKFLLSASDLEGTDDARRVWQLMESCLTPHLERAQGLHIELTELTRQRDGLEAALSRVPLGMAVVRANGEVVSMNRAMMSIAHGGSILALRAGVLMTPRQPMVLPQAIHGVLTGSNQDDAIALEGASGEPGMSIWLSALQRRARASEPLVLVLVASGQSRALSSDALMTLYRLTPTEARMTQQLALGQSLEDAGRTLGITVNTAKTHCKRIFEKMGVRRQSELVQAVYASPLWLMGGQEDLPADEHGLRALLARRRVSGHDEGVLTLPDGRRLAYSDQGDPGGVPVLFMHGLAGSRYLRHPDDSLLIEHGVRLIIAERPGCGDSDPDPKRRIADWPSDLAALLDHLGVGRCVVMGYSAGTPYALAVAQAWGERVQAVHLVAPIAPVARLSDLAAYPAASRLNVLMARYAPAMVRPLMGIAVKDMRQNVFRYVETSMAQSSPSDREVYANPLLRTAHALGVLAGIQHGANELTQDVMLTCGDWGIDFRALRGPIHMWHGEADPLVAPQGARQLSALIPGSQLTMVPGAGHFLLYSHWPDILRRVAATQFAPA